MTEQALSGIKVLDLTHYVAGPYCTKLLADFGAEVVKVERPGIGDATRSLGPFYHDEPHPEKSLLFAYLNTSKQSVTLNLKTVTGKQILKRLAEEADVLVESFSPRVMQSLGLDYESLREVNPSLVMVSLSNFGQTGPYRDYKSADIVAYAMGGLMYIFGDNSREPLKHALRQAQFKAGTNAAIAVNIAIFHEQFTGQGQHVDVSIQESLTSALRDTTSLYTYSGAVRQRQFAYTGEMPRSPVATRDGYAVPIHFGGSVDWEAMAEFLDAPELKDEKFSTAESRLANAKELHDVLREGFSKWDKYELFHAAHKRRGHIYGVVQSPAEVVDSPQYKERGYFADIEHPIIGNAKYPGAPFIMSRTPWQAQSPAPTLGQHNEQVLCDKLGYSRHELTQLRASRVI